MALTVDQLRDGISYWRGTDWGQDFQNSFYEYELARVQMNGQFNEQWWGQFLPILREWIATRPYPHAVISARARERFEALREAWATAVAPYLDNDIAELEWHQIEPFPLVVAEIKDVASPVFTSKFCHFLAPRIFPVVDNKAMGNPFPTYEAYFTTGRREWLETDRATQDELVALLTKEIGAPLFGRFPMKCKLIELCLMGRHYKRKEARALKVEGSKPVNGRTRGNKNNASYAVRAMFLKDMTLKPEAIFAALRERFPDIKLATVSTLMSDARASYECLADLNMIAPTTKPLI
jgi:hypothetical protein